MNAQVDISSRWDLMDSRVLDVCLVEFPSEQDGYLYDVDDERESLVKNRTKSAVCCFV